MKERDSTTWLVVALVAAWWFLQGPGRSSGPIAPEPDLRQSLTEYSCAVGRQVRDRGSRAAAAGRFEEWAADLDSNRDPAARPTLTTPQQAADVARRELAGEWSAAWTRLAAKLDAMEDAGELERTVYGLAEAFRQIARGLRCDD